MSGRHWSARAAVTAFVLSGGEERSLLMILVLAVSAAAHPEGKTLLAAQASKATDKVFIASHSRILIYDIRSGEAVVNTDGQVRKTSCRCLVQHRQVRPVAHKATSSCTLHKATSSCTLACCRDSTMASCLVTMSLPAADQKRSGRYPGRGCKTH